MKAIKSVSILLVAISAMCLASTSSAIPIVGVAVDNFTDQNVVGSTVFRPALSGAAIKYYIPLAGSDCTYGVSGCGTSSDYGSGGPTLSMNIMFNSVEQVASTLLVDFEDLDLTGANDPNGFFESVQVFDENGNAITTLITDISDSLVSGNADTQQLLSLNLGVLTDITYFLTLNFSANYINFFGNPKSGWNTPEYLIATVDQTTVPEPTTVGLLALGLLGIGAVRYRKQYY